MAATTHELKYVFSVVDGFTAKFNEIQQKIKLGFPSNPLKNLQRSVATDSKKVATSIGDIQKKLSSRFVTVTSRPLESLSKNVAVDSGRINKSLSSASLAVQKFNETLSFTYSTTAAMSGVEQFGLEITSKLSMAATAAIDFESAMADVKKVVDFPTPQALSDFEQTLAKMATMDKIPLSVQELSSIAAAAGQLGVELKNIPDFTETTAKMSTAFDIAANKAGDAMAKMSNIYKIPIASIGKLGDAINHLSNNTAAKASEMVEAVSRIGGMAQPFGLTAVQATALANTMIALGKAPDVAATGINALLNKLSTASKQGEKFQGALELIGINAKSLEKSIGKDAQGALLSFLETIEKVQKNKQIGVLIDLFGAEYGDDIASLVGGLDQYRKALKLVAKETDYLGSMQKEFEARAATTANSIQLLKNRLNVFAIDIGNMLLPYLNKAIESIGQMIDATSLFVKENQGLIKSIMAVGAGLSGFLISIAAFGKSVNVVISTMAAFRLAISLVISPLGILVTSLTTAAVLIYKNWESLSAFFKGFFEGFKKGIAPITTQLNKLTPLFNNVKQAISSLYDSFQDLLKPVSQSKAALLEFFSAGKSIGEKFGSLFSKGISSVINFVADYQNVGIAIIETISEGIIKAKDFLWNSILKVFNFVADLFPHSPAKAGPFANLIAWGEALIETFAIGISKMGGLLWEELKTAFDATAKGVDNFIDWLSGVFLDIEFGSFSLEKLFESSISATTKLFGNFISNIGDLLLGIETVTVDIWKVFKEGAARTWSNFTDLLAGIFNWNNIKKNLQKLVDFFNPYFAEIRSMAIKLMADVAVYALQNPAISAAISTFAYIFRKNPVFKHFHSLIKIFTSLVSIATNWVNTLATALASLKALTAVSGLAGAILAAITYRKQLQLVGIAIGTLSSDIQNVDFRELYDSLTPQNLLGFWKEFYGQAQDFWDGTFIGSLLDSTAEFTNNFASFVSDNKKLITVLGVAIAGLYAKFKFLKKDPCRNNPMLKCFKKQSNQLLEMQRQHMSAAAKMTTGRAMDNCGNVIEGEYSHIDDDKKTKKVESEKKSFFQRIKDNAIASAAAVTLAWRNAIDGVSDYVKNARFRGSMSEEGSQSEINRRTQKRGDEIIAERGYTSKKDRRKAYKEARSEATKEAASSKTLIQKTVVALDDFWNVTKAGFAKMSQKIGAYLVIAKAKIIAFSSFLMSSAIGQKISGVLVAGFTLAKARILAFFSVLARLPFIATAASMAASGLATAMTFMTGPIGIAIVAVTALAGAVYLIYQNWGNIGPFFTNLWSNTLNIFQTYSTKIVNFLNSIWSGLGTLVAAFGNLILGLGTTAKQLLESVFLALQGDFANAGSALIQALGTGITTAATFIYDAFFAILEMIGLYLPHSDAEKGPLSNLTAAGMAIPKTLAAGVLAAANTLISAITYPFKKAFEIIKQMNFASAVNTVRQNVPIYDKAINATSGLFSKLFGNPEATGENAVNAVGEGIKKAGATPIKDPLNKTFTETGKLLPHSDAEEGEFATLTKSGAAIPEQLAIGVRENSGVFISSIQDMIGQANNIITTTPLSGTGITAPAGTTEGSTNYGVNLPDPKVMTVQNKGQITDIIRRTAKKHGIAEEDFLRFAAIETGNKFDPRAYNKGSKAKGLFQFIPSTAKAYGIAGREFDAAVNTDAAARLYKDNMKQMKRYGIKTSAANMYLAHQQGVGGLRQIVQASKGERGLKKNIKRNIMWNVPGSVKNKMAGKSDQEISKIFLQHWQNKFAAIDVSKITKTAKGKATLPSQHKMAMPTTAPKGGKFSHKGLNLKSREAIAGGGTKEGTFALGHAIQKNVTSFNRFTAFDDAYHHSKAYKARKKRAGKSTFSTHQTGRALDFTIHDPSKSALATNQVKQLLKAAGVKGHVLDEYKVKTAGATGGHIHVNFKTDAEAEKFKQYMLAGSKMNQSVAKTSKAVAKTSKQVAQDTNQLPKQAKALKTGFMPTGPKLITTNFLPRKSKLPSSSKSPLGEINQESPLGNILQKSPLGNILQKSPLGDIIQKSPIGNILQQSPLGGMIQESPLGKLGNIVLGNTDLPFHGDSIPQILRNQSFQKTITNSSTSGKVTIGDVNVNINNSSGEKLDPMSIGKQIKAQLETAMSDSWRGNMYDI